MSVAAKTRPVFDKMESINELQQLKIGEQLRIVASNQPKSLSLLTSHMVRQHHTICEIT